MTSLDDLNEALVAAAYAHQVDEVRRLLARGASPDARWGERRTTALIEVVDEPDGFVDVPMVQLLLDAGADPSATDASGNSPLHAAIRSAEATALLLSAGADPNVGNEDGVTPLHMAAYVRSTAVARLLVRAGVEIAARDARQRTALDWLRRGLEEDAENVFPEELVDLLDGS